jgi:hypothetical protein
MLHIGSYLVLILRLFLLALLGRLILDYVRLFARSWRPRGVMLFIAETIYAIYPTASTWGSELGPIFSGSFLRRSVTHPAGQPSLSRFLQTGAEP